MINSVYILFQQDDAIICNKRNAVTILELKLSLVNHLEMAIDFFHVKNNFSKLDPHVGDNLCQIRACFLINLCDKILGKYDIKGRLSKLASLKSRIIDVKSKITDTLMHAIKKQTIKNFLLSCECYEDLYEHEVSLLYFFVLSWYKKLNGIGDMCMDYAALENSFNITHKTAKKLVHKYQIRASELSCDFIKYCVSVTSRFTHLSNTIGKMELIDKDLRHIMPIFVVTDILIEYILQIRKSIVLTVERRHGHKFLDNVFMLFIPNKDKSRFIYHEIESLSANDPMLYSQSLLVYGTVCYQENVTPESRIGYIKRFNSFGIVESILYNMAAHPQYSEYHLPSYRHDPFQVIDTNDLDSAADLINKFNKKLENAYKCGCSINNNSLFFIRHIMCDSLINVIQQCKME